MSFPVDDILLGPDTFGALHRLDGVIEHTGEEPAFTRDYAVSTAMYQLNHPGSYNFRVYDRASDPRGVMLNVPYLEASGGINPSSAYWAPGRFPFLKRELDKSGSCPVRGCGGAYLNPTMHHLQVSYVGRTAQLNAGLAPVNFVKDGIALLEWMDALSIRGPAPLVVSKHAHWQTNRSDCGDWMYTRLLAVEEEHMDWVDRIQVVNPPQQVVYRAETSYRLRPDLSPESSPVVLGYPDTRVVVGKVAGEDFGAGPNWDVIVSNNGGLKVAHEQDAVSRTPMSVDGDGVPVDEVHAALLDMQARTIAAYTAGGTAAAKAVST